LTVLYIFYIIFYQSQNKFQGIRVFVALLFKLQANPAKQGLYNTICSGLPRVVVYLNSV